MSTEVAEVYKDQNIVKSLDRPLEGFEQGVVAYNLGDNEMRPVLQKKSPFILAVLGYTMTLFCCLSMA